MIWSKDIDITLGRCFMIIGEMYGYRNWQDLLANLGPKESLFDAEAGEAITAARRAHHESVLVDYGFSVELAKEIIELVTPTGTRRKEPSVQESGEKAPSAHASDDDMWANFDEIDY